MGLGDRRVIGLFAAAVLLFALWLLAEARSRTPLIDLRVMRLPWCGHDHMRRFLFGAGMYAIWSFLPGFVQTPSSAGYGFCASVTAAGLLMLPMLLARLFCWGVSGRLEPVLGAKKLLTTGAALVWSPVASSPWHDQQWHVAFAAGIFGLGIGLAFASMANLIVGSVPPSRPAPLLG